MKNDKILKTYLEIISEASNQEVRYITSNFEEEVKKAIEAKELIRFNYMKKDGTFYKMTILPTQFIPARSAGYGYARNLGRASTPSTVRVEARGAMCKGYLNGIQDKEHERMLYIDSMGERFNENDEKEKMLKEYIEKNVPIVYKVGRIISTVTIKRIITNNTGDRVIVDNDDRKTPLKDIEIIAPLTPSNTEPRRINDNFFEEFKKAAENKELIIVRVDRFRHYVKDMEFVPFIVNNVPSNNGYVVFGVAKGSQGYYNDTVQINYPSEKPVAENAADLVKDEREYAEYNKKRMEEYKASLTDEEREACNLHYSANAMEYMKEDERNRVKELNKIHDRLRKEHPEMHRIVDSDNSNRGYTYSKCSCGYSYSCDSSD